MVGEATYALPVGEVIDLKAEGARLQKEIKKLADEIAKIDAKLGNAAFVAAAPEEVVEEQRERRQPGRADPRAAQHGAETAGRLRTGRERVRPAGRLSRQTPTRCTSSSPSPACDNTSSTTSG